MKWSAAAAIAAAIVGIYLVILLVIWPWMLWCFPYNPGYTLAYRSCRVATIVAPAIFLMGASGLSRRTDFSRAVAGVGALVLFGLIGWTVYDEVHRLSRFSPAYTVG